MKRLQTTLIRIALAALLMGSGASAIGAGLDLVGHDTDLFTTNPAIPAQVPNVLIVIDNSANWSNQAQNWPATLDPVCVAAATAAGTAFGNQQGDAEVCAIYLTIQNLTQSVNVGLMMMNDQAKGAYVRFPMSSMTPSNVTAFKSTLVNINTNNPGDKAGQNDKYENTLNDVFRYFNSFATYTSNATAAAASRSGYSDPAPVTTSNPVNPTGACISGYCNNFQFVAGQNGDTCGYDYVIFIGNGWPPQSQAISPDLTNAAALFNDSANVTANTAAIQNTGINPDVWTRFMFQYGVKINTGTYRHITTYTIEVCNAACDKVQNDRDFATAMKSMAAVSQGKYTRATSLSQIQTALTNIFAEVQAVNSVFAATTLPVSINVRGTNLNQVYIGVFRPDALASPRWFGNLKQYQLGVDSSTGALQLVDSSNTQAVNLNTGFVSNTATSFWSSTYDYTGTGLGFWNFRSAGGYATTDVGKDQDAPDGDLVEKGGAAERIRIAYPLPDSSGPVRNIYTCTGSCAAGSSLSSFLFNDANTDITASLLRTYQLFTVNLLTASGTTATATTSAAHGFAVNDVVTIAGAVPNLFNGNFTITAVTTYTFTFTLSSTPDVTHAYVTQPSYTLVPGTDLVTVASATPTAYNVTSAAISAVTANANQFSYALGSSPTSAASGYSVTGVRRVQASGGTSNVTWSNASSLNNVTVNLSSHGYSSGDTIAISGATDAAFNTSGSVIVKTGTSQFTYTTASTPSGGTTTTGIVTLTGSLPSGWGNGTTVKISGVTNQTNYNTSSSGASISAVSGNTFQYTTSGVISANASGTMVANKVEPADTSTWSISSPATATNLTGGNGSNNTTFRFTLTNGKFSQQVLNQLTTSHTITISGTCSYDTKSGNTTTTRSCTGSQAIAAISGNSSTTTTTVGADTYAAISGTVTVDITPINPDQYVGGTLSVTGTVAGSAPGAGATLLAWTGQTVGANVPITSITPGALTVAAGGTVYASKSDDLTSKVTSITNQSVATGTMTAGLATVPDTAERTHLINWVRGQDNKDDENSKDGSLSVAGVTCAVTNTCDVRTSVHGDVLHSRPAVINYNRYGDNNDVYIFYGANDGMLHAMKGGQATDGSAGNEQWTFIAPEHFGQLKRLRNQTPVLSSANPKDYFFDGPIGVYTLDGKGTVASPVAPDSKLTSGDGHGDKVYLFAAMRRGGRMIYAFDVTDPTNPALLWKKGCPNATGTSGCDTGWDQIGQTWSQPQPVYLRAYPTTLALVFGAGYDPAAEDFQPCSVTAYDSSSVQARINVVHPTPMTAANCPPSGGTATTGSRTMGRGVFIVNANTGAVLWRAGPDGSADYQVSGMTYAIPADLAILRNRSNTADRSPSIGTESVPIGYMDKIYAPDTGGNVWRLDVADADPTNWVVTKFASVATASASSTTTGSPAATAMRKFEFQPDVVYTSDANGPYDAVLLGSGDREHPFDQVVVNRFYMFKDRNVGTLFASTKIGTATPKTVFDPVTTNTSPAAPATIVYPAALTESSLFDVTSGCLQDLALCAGTGTAAQQAQQNTDNASLLAASGWLMQLANTGEKTIAPGTTAAGHVIFNTNQPKQDTVTGTSANVGANAANACVSDLGTARQYGLDFQTGNAADCKSGSSAACGLFNKLPAQYVPSSGHNRFAVFAGGGFLPQPVPAVVQIGGKYYQTVIAGVQATNPGGLSLQHRVRTYWYKKID
jgi:Tfp pilus tip-associated adhesin PilY1